MRSSGAGLAKLSILFSGELPLQQSANAGGFTPQEVSYLLEVGNAFIDGTLCKLPTSQHERGMTARGGEVFKRDAMACADTMSKLP
jgi:hypothetical protein